jgi:hypothetical protein
MNLAALFSITSDKGLIYISGTNTQGNSSLHLEFSSGYNGRGSWIELRIGDVMHDIEYCMTGGKRIKYTDITEQKLFQILRKL